jgi:hypothetical protein
VANTTSSTTQEIGALVAQEHQVAEQPADIDRAQNRLAQVADRRTVLLHQLRHQPAEQQSGEDGAGLAAEPGAAGGMRHHQKEGGGGIAEPDERAGTSLAAGVVKLPQAQQGQEIDAEHEGEPAAPEDAEDQHGQAHQAAQDSL